MNVHDDECAMSRAASGGANPFSVACTCVPKHIGGFVGICDECDPSVGCFDGSVACQKKPAAPGEAQTIAAWLCAGAGEKRGLDTVAFQDSIMPILRDLADRIERGERKRFQ